MNLLPNTELDCPIVYEDPDLIVLDKPAGLPCYPIQYDETETVANFLVAYNPLFQGIGEDLREAGLVHRLDNETSGLLIAAKNKETYDCLRRDFSQKGIEKEYRAIVLGHPVPHQKIKWPIGPHPKGKKRMKVFFQAAAARRASAREAMTAFEVLKKFPRASLLKVTIKTGCRHQIRVHLAALGYPILGDTLYGQKNSDSLPDPPRLCLHAFKMTFLQPRNKKRITVQAPLPEDLKKILRTL